MGKSLLISINQCVIDILFVAPPLSLSNVVAVLNKLSWSHVGEILKIPETKLDTIEDECDTDEERLLAIVRYWLLNDPNASWRRLIRKLDIWDHSDIADRIRKYAEKLTG